jgi:hypothetical protein
MTRFSPSRSFILALCVASALLAPSAPAFADSSRDPAVTEARADGGVLHILGLNLGGGRPKVTLGTLQLSVVSMTATQIDAVVPSTVAPGSYLLSVSFPKGRNGGDDRNDDSKYDEFWVTIGAAGPQGLVGPQGPAGKDGATGIQGAQGPAGSQGLTGPSGPQGSTGVQGPQGVAGKDGATGPSGTDGATGPQGPQGPPGSGGSPFAIESLAGVPCTVAMCPGSTAAKFDPISSSLVLSCVTIPANNTLRIQGTLKVSQTIPGGEVLSFTSDVQGFAGEIPNRVQSSPVAFDVPANNLCSGRAVVVTVTRSRDESPFGIPRPSSSSLNLDGGSCVSAPLDFSPAGKGNLSVSVTCNFTMNGNQTLTIH